MIAKTLVLFATLALAAAAPQAQKKPPTPSKPCKPSSTTGPVATTPTLPVNGGARELPSPPAGMSLKHIALGLGYQNYTCDAAGATAKAAGALAGLYDVLPLYPGQSPKSLSLDGFLSLTKSAAWTVPVPLNLETSTAGRQPNSEPPASLTNPFKAPAPLNLAGSGVPAPIAFAGVHLFDSAGVPTFLVGADTYKVAKNDSINAPTNASPGEDGSAPIAWLYLTSVAGSAAAQAVFRVATVGGSPHTCVNAGTDSSIYGALYYFYS